MPTRKRTAVNKPFRAVFNCNSKLKQMHAIKKKLSSLIFEVCSKWEDVKQNLKEVHEMLTESFVVISCFVGSNESLNFHHIIYLKWENWRENGQRSDYIKYKKSFGLTWNSHGLWSIEDDLCIFCELGASWPLIESTGKKKSYIYPHSRLILT